MLKWRLARPPQILLIMIKHHALHFNGNTCGCERSDKVLLQLAHTHATFRGKKKGHAFSQRERESCLSSAAGDQLQLLLDFKIKILLLLLLLFGWITSPQFIYVCVFKRCILVTAADMSRAAGVNEYFTKICLICCVNRLMRSLRTGRTPWR